MDFWPLISDELHLHPPDPPLLHLLHNALFRIKASSAPAASALADLSHARHHPHHNHLYLLDLHHFLHRSSHHDRVSSDLRVSFGSLHSALETDLHNPHKLPRWRRPGDQEQDQDPVERE